MTLLNDGFDQPHEISPAQRMFPANVVGALMPAHSDIPNDYPDRSEWSKFVSYWFFEGSPFDRWTVGIREGVNPNKALAHLQTILGSWEPKHEHKEAAVAWLASRWYDGIQPKEAA